FPGRNSEPYVLLTINQSGWSMSFRRWQELVVTELAPAHHSREKSQRSLTTHRFTVTFLLRSQSYAFVFSASNVSQHATHILLINTLLCMPPRHYHIDSMGVFSLLCISLPDFFHTQIAVFHI
uniref:Uncharacterized protein n=1 Tax=Sander lucioperca TaxID=283035 RepID=A0A8D0AIG0_SANLU